MRPIPEPGIELSWLIARADPGFSTGYDVEGWEASTWVLHAMYEDPGLPGDVTHDGFTGPVLRKAWLSR